MSNIIDAREIKNAKNIVIYGASTFFTDNYNNLIEDIHPRYIFTNGGVTAGTIEGLEVLSSAEEITKLEQPFVLLAIGKESGINYACKYLKKLNIPFDHLIFYTKSGTFSLKYLKAMECYDYRDYMSNHYIIDKNVSSKIVIYRRKNMAYNNQLLLKSVSVVKELKISLWGRNSQIVLKNSSVVQAKMEITTNGKIIFGDDCMISFDVFVGQADQHHIFDLNTGMRINNSKGIFIGNHVWLGKGSELLDGAIIRDGSILAANAVTSHPFETKNVIIAGVPGKIIRENVIWTRDEQGYNYQKVEDCLDKKALKYI